jgi:hypothetical protein
MAITQAVANSFKGQLLQGQHNFTLLQEMFLNLLYILLQQL